MKKSGSIGNKVIPVTFLLVLLAIWQLVVDAGIVQRFILPSPTDILKTAVNIVPKIKNDIMVTLYEALAGFLISIIFSMVLAILMDSFKLLYKAVYPLLIVSQTIPVIALAPLFVLWFGFGALPKIIVVVLVCFFPIVVSLLDGLGSTDTDLLNLMKSMGAGRLQIFRLVKFPAAMVNFFSGVRIAATYSIMGAVIGEWLGGSEGIGLLMINAKRSFLVDRVFAEVLIIVILSMLLFKLISILQYIFMPWNRNMDRKQGGNQIV